MDLDLILKYNSSTIYSAALLMHHYPFNLLIYIFNFLIQGEKEEELHL